MNRDLIQLNELNANSRGGTELMMDRLYDGRVPRELLEKVQIIPSRVRTLDPDRKHVFWAHDLPNDPEAQRFSDPLFRRKFDKLVFVSNWQLQAYSNVRGIKYSESTVIRNAIEPIPLVTGKTLVDRPIKLIYHTTPHRGLDILVPVFIKLAEEFSDIELDVYSSFGVYGWKERDEAHAQIIKQCVDHPKINYHGAVSNDAIRNALATADIFAYPSIWMETSCLSLMEAMSAGLLCIHPNLAALPETSLGLTWMYDWNENINSHAHTFYAILHHAISTYRESFDGIQVDLQRQKFMADLQYSWPTRSNQWTALLASITRDSAPTT